MNHNNISAGACADLHVHTSYSDGVLTPREVVDAALGLGLKAIGITDHDCVDGIIPSIKVARGKGLEIIPGIEMSASKGDTEIHVLGYFIDPEEPELVRVLGKMRKNRVDRIHKILEKLKQQGVEIDESKVFSSSSEGTLGRLHLARVLVEEKVVRNTREAFERFMGDGQSCHIKHKRLDYTRAIELIRGSGGVPVLAHPGTMGKDEYIEYYIEAGLRGLEAFHTKHRPSANKRYKEIAKKHGLLVTGGSDCHGVPFKKGELVMGKVTVGYDVVEQLREESERIRRNG